MMWIAIPVIGIIVLTIFSIIGNRNAKNYYLNEPEKLQEESEPLQKKVLDLVKSVQPNLENTIAVNGHFSKQVTVGLQVTTFYSYAILFNTATKQLQVISYNHEKNTAQDCGSFASTSVEAIDVNNGAQTNYVFKDEQGKKAITVQTCGHDIPGENEYQIKYFQEENYNILRNAFNLQPFSMSKQLKGESK